MYEPGDRVIFSTAMPDKGKGDYPGYGYNGMPCIVAEDQEGVEEGYVRITGVPPFDGNLSLIPEQYLQYDCSQDQ